MDTALLPKSWLQSLVARQPPGLHCHFNFVAFTEIWDDMGEGFKRTILGHDVTLLRRVNETYLHRLSICI